MGGEKKLNGPDLTQGVARSAIPADGMLLGHALGEAVLLSLIDGDVHAVGARCTHYGASLAKGLRVGDTVRCPWHHACFSLRTGEMLRTPALNPVPCFRVEHVGDVVYVREKLATVQKPPLSGPGLPASVVIIGGGAAGNAAAEELRKQAYAGSITMISADDSVPYDRPNLSKDYLAGNAPEDWIPLRAAKFYQEHRIDVKLATRVVSIDVGRRTLTLANGETLSYDALLLATGAEPVRMDVAGGNLPHVHYLRTLADSRALVLQAAKGKCAVVIGASFIGLEVTASLRTRGVEVQVVGRESQPMAKVLGPEVGDFIRKLHEKNGVKFHFGTAARSFDEKGVTLENGTRLDADLIVVGIGVRPVTTLAEQAGLAIDRGIAVNEYLETSARAIYAAGDIARWPDRLSGERIRVEHWVVAQRQGQTAARNILGRRERFDQVPFFWTQQYEFSVSYMGHAAKWDKIDIDGDIADNCTITYRRGDKTLAVATVNRDFDGLRAEVELERYAGNNE
jgi:NADPH-dependent 2,4-dienoyl-CoA reductase/sulfur reductase-like enzyme/nitrite reductase/ring-hydroxylating ferredoxin subunit